MSRRPLAALWLLRSRSRIAIAVIWLFVLETVADFVNASVISIRERTSETAHALTWLILNMYVPLLGGEPRPARLASGVSSTRICSAPRLPSTEPGEPSREGVCDKVT